GASPTIAGRRRCARVGFAANQRASASLTLAMLARNAGAAAGFLLFEAGSRTKPTPRPEPAFVPPAGVFFCAMTYATFRPRRWLVSIGLQPLSNHSRPRSSGT